MQFSGLGVKDGHGTVNDQNKMRQTIFSSTSMELRHSWRLILIFFSVLGCIFWGSSLKADAWSCLHLPLICVCSVHLLFQSLPCCSQLKGPAAPGPSCSAMNSLWSRSKDAQRVSKAGLRSKDRWGRPRSILADGSLVTPCGMFPRITYSFFGKGRNCKVCCAKSCPNSGIHLHLCTHL